MLYAVCVLQSIYFFNHLRIVHYGDSRYLSWKSHEIPFLALSRSHLFPFSRVLPPRFETLLVNLVSRSKKPSPPTPSPDANGTQISSSPGSPPHPKLRRSHSMNSVMSDVAETDMVPPAESTPRRTEDGASATGVDGRPFVDRSTPRRSPASSFNRNVGDSGEIGVRGDVGRERAIRSNSDTAEPSAGNRRARTSGSDGLRISPRGRTNSSPRSGGGVPTGWASPRPTECSGIGESARKNNGFSDSGGGEKAGGSRVNVASIRSRWEERSSIGSSGGGGGGGSGDRGRGDVGFGLIRRSSFGVDTDAKGRGSRRNTVGPFPR